MIDLSELRTKLVAYTILIVLAVSGGFAMVSITMDHRNLVAAYERQVTALAKTLSEAVVEPMYDLDIKLLRQQVISILKNNGASAAYILDADGRVLTDGTDENLSRGSPISNFGTDQILQENSWVTKHRSGRVTVSGPIVLTDDHVLGFVVIDFSTEELEARRGDQIRLTLFLSVLGALLASLVAVAAARQVTRPINRLTEFAVRIKEGSSDRAVPYCGKGEVGRLAQSFSSMLTKLDKSNQDLLTLTETLEEKVRERTKAAEESSRAKSEFLSTISHEFRTPMNGVLGMASMLEETDLDEDQELFVRTILESGEALQVIINDILDFSKIETGEITLQEEAFNLDGLLRSIVHELYQRASEKNLSLEIEYSPNFPKTLIGDEGRIRQIIASLVDNAEKFTTHGSIRIVVSELDDQGRSSVDVAVQDTGIGIPEGNLTSIFERFSQVDSKSNREFGGTGLGLAIASDLATLMGGTIQVKSEVEKGSIFTFRCPLKPAKVA